MTTRRVFRLTESTRQAFLCERDQTGESKEAVLASAVAARLPSLVDALVGFGLAGREEARRPIRVPVTDETLAALQDAAELTGVAQTTLVECVLHLHCSSAKPSRSETRASAEA